MNVKRIGSMMLCLLVLAVFSSAAAERRIPDVLRVTQDIQSGKQAKHRVITRSVLHSAREDVNEAINARVAALAEETEGHVPAGRAAQKTPPRGDICTQVTRTGDRWMSFHICAQASAESRQLWVKSEEYTYDMETGRLIRLGDIVSEAGWEPLIREIRTQLKNRFPGDKPVMGELNRLCTRENLTGAGFVMTPGHLALYFPAGGVYPAHAEALLRVEIYVPELREILTEEAKKETDCTGYSLVALTYDDGPMKGRTREIRNASVRYPVQLTFFLIGNCIGKNTELVHLEYDAGHSVQSHTWMHTFDLLRKAAPDQVMQWEERFNETLGSLIGVYPVMMRPPGGDWKKFSKAGTKLPMILWSVESGDAINNATEADMFRCYNLIESAQDGDIILCHDGKSFYGTLAEMCMARFEERDILLVTVDDLCALRGVPLEAGMTLKACPPEDGAF